ncbi:ComF family protein [Cytobacillus sp. NCCP-133]|uniref:ComF family protein n=1 Tax=Cytobacillus sp. NCCP-133 TaxID=766848 RepID=UPI00222F7FE9|nr:ComF family protein [Cytobacillus sp. NCCP-133]GLB60203.1 amidophosphoribosyltransferase [Cytobacillus sp. NCCP-133]
MLIKCLICHQEISPVVTWSSLWSKPEENDLCKKCSEKLNFIEGEACEKCSRPFSGLDPRYRTGNLCHDCTRWNEDPEWGSSLERNQSLFLYDDFLKEAIARYKFRGDYILARAFSPFIKSKLQTLDFDLLVPIPLSSERLYERGFNQSAALIREAGFTAAEMLKRTHAEKQSKKARNERIHLQQVFQRIADHDAENKKIILIDDIYTTGSTLYHAAKILKEAGAASVCSLTIAR